MGGVLITVKTFFRLTIAAAITDADGSYNISGLDEGSYTITASVAQYGSQQQTASYNPSFGTTTVNDFSLTATSVTGVSSETNNLPSKFLLQNNYPNPFNPSTIISFTLPINSRVRLEIYNILGQKVADLINKQMNAGSYNITFNASNLIFRSLFVQAADRPFYSHKENDPRKIKIIAHTQGSKPPAFGGFFY